jgi:two-component system cell cycle sensor histidine kinase/response regulator CckA
MIRIERNRINALKISVLFLWIFCSLSLIPAYSETGDLDVSSTQKRVVLLNSYHKGYLWTDEITRGVEDTLAASGVELHVEYMDTKRQFDIVYQDMLSDLLNLKYRRHDYDVVITSDNNAFNFFQDRGCRIFGDTPHVFCGVNYVNEQDLKGITNTTGVNERADIAGNLVLIRRLHPDCRNVVVITDDTTTGKRIQEEVRRLMRSRWFSGPKLKLLYDVSATELIRAVRKLPPQTIVLFTLFFRDNTGVFFEYDQGSKMVCDHSAVPVYGTWHFQLNHGIIGGHLVGGYDQGAAAAQKALMILAGKNAGDIPLRYETPTQLKFDFRQLQRHGIPLSLLPPGSQILNQPVSFYDQYKKLIWIIVSTFCLLLMAFLGVAYGLVRSRQAERKLRRNEENLRTTLHSIGDAVIATDADGKVVRMNPVAEILTGWRMNEANGRPLNDVFQIINAKTNRPAGNPVEKVLATGEIVSLADHTTLISKNGSEYQIADSGAPIRDAAGSINGVVLVFQDITEEYQLREQYRNMAFLVASASIPIVMSTIEGNLSHVNPAFLKTWGYDRPDEVLGRSVNEFWVVGDRIAEILNTVETENIEFEEVQALKKDGTIFSAQFSAAAVRDDNGRPVALMASSLDITKRKLAEAARNESEARYRNLFESAGDAILLMTGDKFIDCNQKALSLYGCSRDVIVGHSPAEFMPPVQPDGRKSHEKATETINAAMAGNPQLFEWQHKKMNGTLFIAEVSLNLVELSTGAYIQAIVRDITERKELEDQLHHSQKMDAVGVLAGGVAHDFNNMLAGILGAAEIIKGNGNLNKEDTRYIEMIIQSSSRAADLTAKLLAFSRKGKLVSTSVDVHSIINDSAMLLKGSIDKKITIHCDLKAAGYMVIGDNSQLQNLLMNLCINSSHAMPDGGEISISTRNIRLEEVFCQASPFELTPGEFIQIEVRDTGVGIPYENRQKIFEPFFTTKQQGKGTGLGLSAVYGIVKNHHGAISVYSEPGSGTVFHILLPGSDDNADVFAENETITKGTGNILLVEDEEFIRITAKSMLEDMGYTVILAENGKAGVDLFKKELKNIDLIILDMVMPVMNGREVFEMMKDMDENVKVIISSGFLKPADVSEIRRIGLSGFIRKPYFKEELSRVVADVLGH